MQKIRIDFDNSGLPQHISAVENDSQSRFFQATLYENGKAYTAPEGATYSIMYHGFGPQNQGWYDTINDGAGKRAACAVSGNVVTCEIARQALQVPGHVSIVLCVTTGKGYMLKSWPIECECKNDRYDSTAEIQSFFYVTQVSNADWTQAIQAWEDLKNTIDPTLSVSGKAADAKATGDAVNAETARAKAAEETNAQGIGRLKEDLRQINPDANIRVIFMDDKFPAVKSYGFTVVGCGGFYISDLTTSSMVRCAFSDIAAQIPEYATWDADSQTFTLNLGSGEKRFGFDTSTNEFTVSNSTQKRNPNIVTLYWMYYQEYGGLIYEYGICHHAYTGFPLDVILQLSAKVAELSGKLTITDSDALYMGNWKKNDREEFSFSDIAAQIPEYATWDADSQTFTLNLGNNGEKRFVYNTATKKFRVDTTLGLMNDEDVVLYWAYYGKAGGILYNEIALRGTRIQKIAEQLGDNDAYVIFYDTTKIVSCGRGGFVLSDADGFYIANRSSTIRTDFSFSDIAAQIPEYATWDADSQTFTLNLGNNGEKRFGFDTSTNKFIVDSITSTKPYGLIVLYWAYYKRYGGKIAEQIATRLYLENKNEYLTSNSIQKDTFNASFHTGAKDFATVCKRYGMLFNGDESNGVIAVDTCESFLWFTDPHLFTATDGGIHKMEEYVAQLQKYYNSTPTTFALCGGDWLGNSDVPEMACYKMGYIDGICRSMFDKCYMLVGNHDTNYQGKKDANSSTYTTRLSRLAIRNLWYRDIGRAYYDFDGANTHFYCFDTGIENQTLEYNNGYGYEQATWFAEKLMNERYNHVAIAAHIYAYSTIPDGTVPDDVQPLTRLLLQISSAYNRRSEISVNGKNYNFVDATGRVEFMLAGHSHEDYTLMDSGIPIIATLDCGNHQSYTADCSFDLVFVDYDNRKIKCIRAGVGKDREINLDN